MVVVGREVAAERAHGGDRQQRQPDRDVGAVEARQPEEDRGERAVAGVEADVRVLHHLREQERETEQDRQHEAGLEAVPVAALDRLHRPVHREARGDEDRRVDPGDEDRELVVAGQADAVDERLLARQPVLPALRSTVDRRVDDADEEVGGEERAEQHRLGGDEQEHAEHRRVEPRAAVRQRRAVVVVVVVDVPRRARHAAPPRLQHGVDDDVLDRDAGVRAQPPDEVAAQPAGALAGERGDDDLVDALVGDRLHRRRVRIRVRDLPVRLDPHVRSVVSAARRRRSASGCAAASRVALRADDQEAGGALGRAAPDPVEQRRAEHGLVRDHEHVRLPRARGDLGDDVLRTGGRRQALRISSSRLRRSQPDFCLGMGGDDQLVDVLLREDVLDRGERAAFEHVAVRGDPGRAQRRDRPVERGGRRVARRELP